MKSKLLLLFFLLVVSGWIFFQPESISSLTKKNAPTQTSSNMAKNFRPALPAIAPSLISATLSNNPCQQLTPLASPPAPLESLSDEEMHDFSGARVVEFAELDGPQPHQKLRLRILETGLTHPYVRTEEIIDTDSGKLLGRLEMSANQLLVTLPPGKDPQQFLQDFGPQGLFMTPVDASLSIYRLSLRDASLSSLPNALGQMKSDATADSCGEPNYIAHTTNKPQNFGYSYQWGLWKNKNLDAAHAFKNSYERYFYKSSHGETDFFKEPVNKSPSTTESPSNPLVATNPALSNTDPSFQKNSAVNPAYNNSSSNSQNSGTDCFSTKDGINAEDAWNVRTDASSVIVGIIDSGIRVTHENLKNNLWHLEGHDDIHGYNAIDKSSDLSDELGHGTHCAGIIGGEGNNQHLGVSGVAWKIQLMTCKCCNQDGSLEEDAIVDGIHYARAHGASILNCSFAWMGGEASIAMSVELQSLRHHGIILVAAAGNSSVDNDNNILKSYPASFSTQLDNIVSVAATDYVEDATNADAKPGQEEGLASFSNYGATTVTLAAPGLFILSTYNTSDTSYAFLSGTSMAAPFVTGSLALLKAQFPKATYHELITHLVKTTDPLPTLHGKMMGGRVNLARAINTTPQKITASAPSTINQNNPSSQPQVWQLLNGPCKRNDWIRP